MEMGFCFICFDIICYFWKVKQYTTTTYLGENILFNRALGLGSRPYKEIIKNINNCPPTLHSVALVSNLFFNSVVS